MSDPFDRVLRAAARRARTVGVCPGPERLAGYLDNGLTSAERASVEAHAADCLRCQQHLSLLGALSVERPDPDAPASRPWLVRWGWLVPVATAVLVVAVWTRTPAPVDAPAQFPRREVAPAVVPAPDPPASAEATGAALGTAATSEADRKRRDLAAQVQPPVAVPAAPLAVPALPPPAAASDQVGQLADSARAPAEAEGKESAASAAPAREEARLMRKAVAPPIEAAASDRERYRVGGGRIERSRDGGASWQEVYSDTSLTFTATACAPNGPCWFGTTAGVVLRSSGDSFTRSRLPEPGAITAIEVTSPSDVIVLVGSRRYRGSDRSSWTLVQ
jgi:hypothetical protein